MGQFIKVSIEKDAKKFERWIDGVRNKDLRQNGNILGRNLTASLKRHSPVDTAEMANSWDYDLESSKNGFTLNITNSSHDETDLSVPILVNNGHGLKGGGYVRANPFIKRAMDSVYDAEMTKLIGDLLDGR